MQLIEATQSRPAARNRGRVASDASMSFSSLIEAVLAM